MSAPQNATVTSRAKPSTASASGPGRDRLGSAPDGRRRVGTALMLVGAVSITAQIVLMRELLSLFQGNELSIGVILAVWLLWTALGSTVLGAVRGRSTKPFAANASAPDGVPAKHVAALQVICGLAMPLAIVAVRYSKVVVPASPGEVLGPERMLVTCIVVLGMFCPFSGLLFTTATRWYMRATGQHTSSASSYAYLLESLGAAMGGLLTSVAIIYTGPIRLAVIVATASLLFAAWCVAARKWVAPLIAAVTVVSVLGWRAAERLENVSVAANWPNLRLLDVRSSRYGNLAMVEGEGNRSLAENGVILFTAPDEESAEEAVHFALLQHPAPRSVLLIGGGVNGSVRQILQHPTVERVDYVEFDPGVLELAAKHLPESWGQMRNDRRVYVHAMDGRAFLRSARQKFDVIICNVPEPQTAQLNRFYTREFFDQAAARLNAGGVFSFQIRAAENYISPARASLLQCLQRTLRESFREVVIVPGDVLHFVATNQPGLLNTDASVLSARVRQRRLQTQYVREYFLPFRLMPERIADIKGQLEPVADTPVNRDFAPIAYYLDVALWSAHFDVRRARILAVLAALSYRRLAFFVAAGAMVIAAAVLVFGRRRRPAAGAGLCITTTGMTLLSLQIFVLLGFQAVYGYVFYELAVIISAFMLGLALGTWLGIRGGEATRRVLARRLAVVQALTIVAPLICALVIPAARAGEAPLTNVVVRAAFPLLAMLCGVIGGAQFPVASRLFFSGSDGRHAGLLYGLDLAGSCLGALAVSLFLLPVYGMARTAGLVAVVDFIALAPLLPAAFSERARRTPTP